MDYTWIQWLGYSIVAVAGWIASKPLLMRMGIRFAIRHGLKVLWKYVRFYRAKFAQGTQQYKDVTEIAEAIEVLCRLAGERLDINIRPKQLEPDYKTRAEKKVERLENKLNKKAIKKTRSGRG